MSDFLRPHEPQHARPLSITNCWSLPKPMSIESVMPSNHHILSCPLLLPSVFPNIRVFSNESALPIRWPKFWRFSFNISLSNEQLGLISFRMDWLDLLAVQGTLKSLLQHHSSKSFLTPLRSSFPSWEPLFSSLYLYVCLCLVWFVHLFLLIRFLYSLWVTSDSIYFSSPYFRVVSFSCMSHIDMMAFLS